MSLEDSNDGAAAAVRRRLRKMVVEEPLKPHQEAAPPAGGEDEEEEGPEEEQFEEEDGEPDEEAEEGDEEEEAMNAPLVLTEARGTGDVRAHRQEQGYRSDEDDEAGSLEEFVLSDGEEEEQQGPEFYARLHAEEDARKADLTAAEAAELAGILDLAERDDRRRRMFDEAPPAPPPIQRRLEETAGWKTPQAVVRMEKGRLVFQPVPLKPPAAAPAALPPPTSPDPRKRPTPDHTEESEFALVPENNGGGDLEPIDMMNRAGEQHPKRHAVAPPIEREEAASGEQPSSREPQVSILRRHIAHRYEQAVSYGSLDDGVNRALVNAVSERQRDLLLGFKRRDRPWGYREYNEAYTPAERLEIEQKGPPKNNRRPKATLTPKALATPVRNRLGTMATHYNYMFALVTIIDRVQRENDPRGLNTIEEYQQVPLVMEYVWRMLPMVPNLAAAIFNVQAHPGTKPKNKMGGTDPKPKNRRERAERSGMAEVLDAMMDDGAAAPGEEPPAEGGGDDAPETNTRALHNARRHMPHYHMAVFLKKTDHTPAEPEAIVRMLKKVFGDVNLSLPARQSLRTVVGGTCYAMKGWNCTLVADYLNYSGIALKRHTWIYLNEESMRAPGEVKAWWRLQADFQGCGGLTLDDKVDEEDLERLRNEPEELYDREEQSKEQLFCLQLKSFMEHRGFWLRGSDVYARRPNSKASLVLAAKWDEFMSLLNSSVPHLQRGVIAYHRKILKELGIMKALLPYPVMDYNVVELKDSFFLIDKVKFLDKLDPVTKRDKMHEELPANWGYRVFAFAYADMTSAEMRVPPITWLSLLMFHDGIKTDQRDEKDYRDPNGGWLSGEPAEEAQEAEEAPAAAASPVQRADYNAPAHNGQPDAPVAVAAKRGGRRTIFRQMRMPLFREPPSPLHPLFTDLRYEWTREEGLYTPYKHTETAMKFLGYMAHTYDASWDPKERKPYLYNASDAGKSSLVYPLRGVFDAKQDLALLNDGHFALSGLTLKDGTPKRVLIADEADGENIGRSRLLRLLDGDEGVVTEKKGMDALDVCFDRPQWWIANNKINFAFDAGAVDNRYCYFKFWKPIPLADRDPKAKLRIKHEGFQVMYCSLWLRQKERQYRHWEEELQQRRRAAGGAPARPLTLKEQVEASRQRLEERKQAARREAELQRLATEAEAGRAPSGEQGSR